jgi:hypothetical protein
MTDNQRKLRELAVAHAELHPDPLVRDAVHTLREENAMLRDLVDQEPEAVFVSTRRRSLGRAIAVLLVVIGLALSALWATSRGNVAEFRRGLKDGYRAGSPASKVVAP